MSGLVTRDDNEFVDSLVTKYAARVNHLSPLVRGSMVSAFRIGCIEVLGQLHDKAMAKQAERLLKEKFLEEKE